MKNKFIAITMAMLCTNISAQSENLTHKIKTYTHKIDSIVGVEKQKMNSEMDIWKSKWSHQEISEKEYQIAKRKIAEKYKTSINAKIEKEREILDSITTQTVQQSIFRKAYKKDNTRVRQIIIGGENTRQHSKSTDILVSYSISNLTESSGFDLFNKESDMRIGNTHSFEIFLRKTHQLGKKKSPFYIHYGLAYRSDTYMPKKEYVFSEENNQLILTAFQDGQLKRSKLRNSYIVAPLEFSWKPTKHWQFGLGGYAGINTRSIIKVKYHNNDDKFRKYKTVIDQGVNPYLLGGKLSVSYRGFTLFMKKDFTPAFDSQAILNHKNNIQLGLVIADIGL